MKTFTSKTQNEAGSVLILSLVTAAILGITLASYLIMTQQQHVSVARSQVWNTSIVMTEAGLEDALGLLNKYAGNVEKLTNWVSTASGDNWSVIAPKVYYVRRYMGDSYYDVYITNANALAPIIYSVGYSPWNYAASTSPNLYATVINPQTGAKMVERKVDLHAKLDAAFVVAMAAIQKIDFNGKNVTTDSFDSADPNYSDNGLYPASDPSKQKDNGDVVTDFTIVNGLNVGNAQIKGRVRTGPNGSVYVGPNGSVGSKSYVESGATGIESGYYDDDMNILFPSAQLPTTTWFPPSGGTMTIDGIIYDVVLLTSGDYTINSCSKGIYVGTNAIVRLYITGNINLNGVSDSIRICEGGQLKIFMAGNTFRLGGNGVVNDDGNANSFYYFGLPSNQSLYFQGNGDFVGAIYAPDTNFYLGGGGSTAYDFIGASITKSVTMNGSYNFHYDENLARNQMGRSYVPTSWLEM